MNKTIRVLEANSDDRKVYPSIEIDYDTKVISVEVAKRDSPVMGQNVVGWFMRAIVVERAK